MAEEKVKKEPLKYTNPRKYHQLKYYGLKAGKWASVIAPLVAVFIARANEYIEVYDGNYIKLTIGGIIALVVAVFAIYKDVKRNEATSPITQALGWLVCFILSYLFYEIIKDLTLVLGVEAAGQCVAAGLEVASLEDYKYLKAYKEEYVKEEARADVQETIRKRRNGTRS